MTSTPAANNWSAIRGVIPSPPAAFSPLTMTKSGASSSRSAGSMPSSVRLPKPPTRSPANRMLMAFSMEWATAPALIITRMRPWARLRRAARRAPEGEPEPEAVEAGGPVEQEGPAKPEPRSGPRPDNGSGQDAAPGTSELELTPGASAVPPVIVPRWVQLVILPLALLALWALARASGTVLLLLVVAANVALILAPVVRLLERVLPRGLAIFMVYLGGFAVIAGIGVLLVSPVTTQITLFEHNVPEIVRHANHQLDNLQTWLNSHGIHVHIKQQGHTALDTLQKNVLKRSGAIVTFSRDLLSQVVTIGFDLILILVLSVYLLVYGNQVGQLARRIMPPGDGTPEDDYPLLVQHAV